jgi:hypothetical protein
MWADKNNNDAVRSLPKIIKMNDGDNKIKLEVKILHETLLNCI